jgi:hypothetical protein
MKRTFWFFVFISAIGILSATADGDVTIWGWTRDGKVGISEIKDAGGRGGIIVTAFVFNTVSDTILWQQEIGFYHDEGYSSLPEIQTNAFLSNFQNVCRQQFGIEIKETRPMVPSESAMRHNGKTCTIFINPIRVEDDMVRSYSVTAVTGGRRKTILKTEDIYVHALPMFSWYSISPFEERALIIIKWTSMSHSYGFVYAGCHLSIGFLDTQW